MQMSQPRKPSELAKFACRWQASTGRQAIQLGECGKQGLIPHLKKIKSFSHVYVPLKKKIFSNQGSQVVLLKLDLRPNICVFVELSSSDRRVSDGMGK